jgi:CubicO group peptidase (beta-lactamase class C family)
VGLTGLGGPAQGTDPLRHAAVDVAPGVHDPRYSEAVEALKAFAGKELNAYGYPGISIALVDARGFAATLSMGVADIGFRTPVTSRHLFQIGSISKSIVSLAIHSLAHAGRLRLTARVAEILPDAPLPDAPITVQHLLNHSSGLPSDTPLFPRVPGGRLWIGHDPGTRYAYSNIGYGILGLVAERASGKDFPALLRDLVLSPLGMVGAEPAIRTTDRERFATGHVAFRDRFPPAPGARLAPAPWVDIDDPAGSVAATASDMSHYLRFIISLGTGVGNPLFSDSMAARFLAPGIDAPEYGAGGRYANGLVHVDVEGRRCLQHTGGMIGFSSALFIDPASGVGCYASVNVGGTGYRPRQIARYGCALLSAVRGAGALPTAPSAATEDSTDAGRYVGQYHGEHAEPLLIRRVGGSLGVLYRNRETLLHRLGEGVFASNDPDLWFHPFHFDAGERGGMTLWWGERLYGRGAPVVTPPVPETLRAMTGLYLSYDPWVGAASIVARGNTLWIEGDGPIVPVADGSWRYRDENRGAERVWFQNRIGSRYHGLSLSGIELRRSSALDGA